MKLRILYRAFRASGPGGQHRNKTETAIEARLHPDDVAVLGLPAEATKAQSTSHKSQATNKKVARAKLASRVKAELERRQAKGRHAAGFDRVRNYHEPDDRVTDSTGLRWSFRETVGKGDLSGPIDGRREALLLAP
ncbi:MAG: peptide chain release factor-like protein [bacterium]|nr:peptide chain release factor-like protein [bacterium]